MKGIGEAGTIGATPAVQNAVIDAVAHLGVRHIDMPTTPLRVWRAIQAARESGEQLVKVHITVNGVPSDDDVEPRLLLVHYLRDVLRPDGRRTSAATRRRAAPARCCSTASR